MAETPAATLEIISLSTPRAPELAQSLCAVALECRSRRWMAVTPGWPSHRGR